MRMKKIYYVFAGLILVAGLCYFNSEADKSKVLRDTEDAALHTQAIALFKPISSVDFGVSNTDMVTLGKYLFFETKLSNKGNISCNSCHNLATYGVDNLATSPGDDGIQGGRNSPTVIYASLHAMQFWDGRAKDVEEQAGGPILNPVEHNLGSEAEVVARIENEELYKEWFAKVFPQESKPISFKNLTKAIGAFERTLNPVSAFDRYLEGDKQALNKQEKKGLTAFMSTGCSTCHNGVALGGQIFQKFGLFADYWTLTKSKNIDKGLGELTKKESDNHFFKVPSLRNIAHTQPYFHDGSVALLEEAIKHMAKAQTNLSLSTDQVDDIKAFLMALSADLPADEKKSPFL